MRGFSLSLILHAGLVAGGMIYLPRAVQLLDTPPIVPVELVTIADTTNIRAAAPEPEPVEEEPEDEATIEDEIVDPAPAPEPEPEAEREVEIIDTEPESVPEPEPEPEEEITPEPEPEPEPQQIVRREPERPAEPSLADLLGDLEREVADARTDQGMTSTGERRRSVGAGEEMTATLQDVLRSHLSRCWRNSLDAPHPDELAVEVELSLSRDGNLAGPARLKDQARILNSPDPYLRVAGERALRAAQLCAPYPLPPENYSQWRQISVNFSPSLYGQ